MSTIQSDFSTQQGEFDANLTLEIEQALGQWGSYVPPVMLMTPASQGGYLNSTPVGVQEVVTNALNYMASISGKVTAAANNDLKAANAALAAGQYVTAYQDYADCYESFA